MSVCACLSIELVKAVGDCSAGQLVCRCTGPGCTGLLHGRRHGDWKTVGCSGSGIPVHSWLSFYSPGSSSSLINLPVYKYVINNNNGQLCLG